MELLSRLSQKLQASQKWMTALQASKQLLSTDSSEAANMTTEEREMWLKLTFTTGSKLLHVYGSHAAGCKTAHQ